MKYIKTLTFLLFTQIAFSQQLAILQYGGGGDWYANPTALPNLIEFCNRELHTQLDPTPKTVKVGNMEINLYPYLHMTGHGNVYFSTEDAENLRTYLLSGGFLHIDDNYGMEPYLRKEILKVFPNTPLEELGKNHPIFKGPFQFPEGLPKIHEHDGKPPQAFGITIEGRLVLLFTFESDLGDGWENPEIHNDPEPVRQKALQMGANIISYIFNQ
ncbi:MAG: DUF4159 domain-containing protein [Flavobacteriaceae bacterium]|nr:DUF4159 domain-containing protein [Flavobacteriaceae bacterium]